MSSSNRSVSQTQVSVLFSDKVEKQSSCCPVLRSMVIREVCLDPVNILLGECGKVNGDNSILNHQADPKRAESRHRGDLQLFHRQRQFPDTLRVFTLEDIQDATERFNDVLVLSLSLDLSSYQRRDTIA